MRKRWTKKELSAFLDGEARDAGRTQDAVQHSADAAAELAAYQRISDRLHAVPAPEVSPSFCESVIARIQTECADETANARVIGKLKSLSEPNVHPGFARRVVAAIEAGQAKRPAAWQFPVSRSAFAAAAAAVIIAIAVFAPQSTTNAPTTQFAETPELAPEALPMDEATLLARIESRLTADADMERMVVARFEPAAEPGDLYNTRLLTALAATGGATGDAFAHGSDYRVTLRRMDREQTSAVAQLLRASVEAAHEG